MIKTLALTIAALIILFSALATAANQQPDLMQANVYSSESHGIELPHYWVSEKYDGVRAYWNGTQLLSRQGNQYHAPSWFIDALPDSPLDGELWLGRGQFDQLSGIVRKKKAIDSEWRQVRYMVFDLPHENDTFDQRLAAMRLLDLQSAWVVIAKQWRVNSETELFMQLDEFVANNAEGLMLHDGRSYYSASRSDDLIKLKPRLDQEAIVLSYETGKGKYVGLMGSMWVEALIPNEQGVLEKRRFKIGSGFSDAERAAPPAIGSQITFQYSGLTSKGNPRFPRFWRQRAVD